QGRHRCAGAWGLGSGELAHHAACRAAAGIGGMAAIGSGFAVRSDLASASSAWTWPAMPANHDLWQALQHAEPSAERLEDAP
ncbi:MAG: hypothetical protein WCN85_17035, partial [Burkholderiales bacterium]